MARKCYYTVQLASSDNKHTIQASDGSVLVFEVGIVFSVFLKSVRYLLLIFQNVAILVSSIFRCLHYFMFICGLGLYEGIGALQLNERYLHAQCTW